MQWSRRSSQSCENHPRNNSHASRDCQIKQPEAALRWHRKDFPGPRKHPTSRPCPRPCGTPPGTRVPHSTLRSRTHTTSPRPFLPSHARFRQFCCPLTPTTTIHCEVPMKKLVALLLLVVALPLAFSQARGIRVYRSTLSPSISSTSTYAVACGPGRGTRATRTPFTFSITISCFPGSPSR